jgi:hypothetical protein
MCSVGQEREAIRKQATRDLDNEDRQGQRKDRDQSVSVSAGGRVDVGHGASVPDKGTPRRPMAYRAPPPGRPGSMTRDRESGTGAEVVPA